MKKTGKEGIQKGIISGTLAVVLVLTAVVGVDFSTRKDAKAGTGMNTGTSRAAVTEKRRIYPSESQKKQIKNPLYL